MDLKCLNCKSVFDPSETDGECPECGYRYKNNGEDWVLVDIKKPKKSEKEKDYKKEYFKMKHELEDQEENREEENKYELEEDLLEDDIEDVKEGLFGEDVDD